MQRNLDFRLFPDSVCPHLRHRWLVYAGSTTSTVFPRASAL